MHDDGFFDEKVAARYDTSAAARFDDAVLGPTVDFLAELAGDGRALELGVGTGRVALPLAARGIEVHGIDMSRAMVAKMREKPGGGEIGVTIGDYSTAKVEGEFSLAYVVFNTITNLTTQEAQVACFRNVAAHLRPGGCFVIEVMMPELHRLPPGETIRPYEMGESRWKYDEYDIANQGLKTHRVGAVGGELEHSVGLFRYVWPAELDLMAEMAGMRLRERWSGWNREPFTSESANLVGVWERVAS